MTELAFDSPVAWRLCVAPIAVFLVAGCFGSPGSSVLHPPATSGQSADDPAVARIHHDAPALCLPAYGGDVAIPVNFRNPSSTEPLNLTLKSKSCECAGFTLAPDVVAPGGDGVMTLNTTFGSATAERQLQLRFETGLKQPQIMEFTIAMRAFPAIEFQPGISPIMLAVPFGQSESVEFDLLVHQPEDETPLVPTVTTDAEELTLATTDEQERVEFGVRRQTIHCVASIAVPPQPEFAKSPVVHEARVEARAGDQTAGMKILWRPENLIQVEPKSLLVNTRQAGFRHKVELAAETAFRIDALNTPSPNLSVETRLREKRRRHTVTVSFDGDVASEKPQKFIITATTDHPVEKQVDIPIYVLK